MTLHQRSHRSILRKVPPRQWTSSTPLLNAVIVPTSRSEEHDRSGIETAAELASKHALRLIFLCSKEAATETALKDLRERVLPFAGGTADIRIATFTARAARLLPPFRVDRLPISTAFRESSPTAYTDPAGKDAGRFMPQYDLGSKRNVGLLMMACFGWDYVLFLDDDVTPSQNPSAGTLDAQGLASAMKALWFGGLSAVGWPLVDFDDNSVVCRARGLADPSQANDQFIGGGALMVRRPLRPSFFPSIYNEDWLFLLGLLEGSKDPASVLGLAGECAQDAYHPWSAPRAQAEELGDLLGEGLLGLQHRASSSSDWRFTLPPGDGYWRALVAERKAAIDATVRALGADAGAEHSPAVQALTAAAAVHDDWFAAECSEAHPGPSYDGIAEFAKYVRAWRNDLDAWRKYLRKPPRSAVKRWYEEEAELIRRPDARPAAASSRPRSGARRA